MNIQYNVLLLLCTSFYGGECGSEGVIYVTKKPSCMTHHNPILITGELM